MVSQVLVIALAAFSGIISDAVDPKNVYRYSPGLLKTVETTRRKLTIQGHYDPNFLVMELPESYMPPSHEPMMITSYDFREGLSRSFIRFCVGDLNGQDVLVFPCEPTARDYVEILEEDDVAAVVDLTSFTGNHRVIINYDLYLKHFDPYYYPEWVSDMLETPMMSKKKMMKMIMSMIDHSKNKLQVPKTLSENQDVLDRFQPVPMFMDSEWNVTVSFPPEGFVLNDEISDESDYDESIERRLRQYYDSSEEWTGRTYVKVPDETVKIVEEIEEETEEDIS